MLIRLITLFLFVSCWTQSIHSASAKESSLQFDIPIAKGADKYMDMLQYPAYIDVALENNGIKPSNMGKPILVDEHTIQLKKAMLHFVEKKGAVYFYNGQIEWDLPFKHLTFKIPMEVDTSFKDKVEVRIFLPLARLFPDAMVQRIRSKILVLSGPEVQNKLIRYLDDLSKKVDPASGMPGLYSKIMLESHNLPVDTGVACTPSEPGDAEPLADQAYLLATLAIWLIIGPATVAMIIFLRNRKNRRTK